MMKNLLRSGFIVLLGTLLYKVAFLVKDILLTSKLGISSELTLFVTAFLIPSFLCNTLAQSLQVSSSASIVAGEKSTSLTFLTGVFRKILPLSIIAYSFLYLLAPFFFTSFDSNQMQELRLISLITLPFFLTMPLRGILGQVLYLRGYYLVNFSLALISPMVLIAYLLLISQPLSSGLMIALSGASVLELLIVYVVTKAVGGISSTHTPSSLSQKAMLNGFLLQFLLMSPPLIDQLFAHLSSPDFLTVYSYAIKIPNIITTISMIVVASVLLPFFIENKGSKVSVTKKKLYLVLAGLIFYYMSVPFLSPMVVQLVYQRGKFTSSDASLVAMIQAYYFYSAPATAFFMAYVRYLNAHNEHTSAVKMATSIAFFQVCMCLFWVKLGRFDLIPFSIIGSYLFTLIVFYSLKKTKVKNGNLPA